MTRRKPPQIIADFGRELEAMQPPQQPPPNVEPPCIDCDEEGMVRVPVKTCSGCWRPYTLDQLVGLTEVQSRDPHIRISICRQCGEPMCWDPDGIEQLAGEEIPLPVYLAMYDAGV